MLEKARNRLNQEIDVYFIVRLHRFLYSAVMDTIDEERRRKLWDQAGYATISSDDSNTKGPSDSLKGAPSLDQGTQTFNSFSQIHKQDANAERTERALSR